MSQNNLPDGWDENKLRQVLAHYNQQNEEEALAEDEAGVAASETVMNVPHDLVSKVRELIAKRHDWVVRFLDEDLAEATVAAVRRFEDQERTDRWGRATLSFGRFPARRRQRPVLRSYFRRNLTIFRDLTLSRVWLRRSLRRRWLLIIALLGWKAGMLGWEAQRKARPGRNRRNKEMASSNQELSSHSGQILKNSVFEALSTSLPWRCKA